MSPPLSSTTAAEARDKTIDMLRFIGLSMIILAHIRIPGVLIQLRCFDVPLVVVVSGLAFISSTSKQSYLSYLWKRVKRLVFPVWIFLTFYFLMNWALQFAPQDLNAKAIVSSYAFLYGIGYIWVIRVFLLIAVAAPFVRYVSGRIDSNKTYLLVLLICWGGYEAFLFATTRYTENEVWAIMSLFVYYAIGYSLIMGFGTRLKKLTAYEVWLVCLVSLAAFVAIGCILYFKTGKVVPTLRYKYPPSTYYVSYAMVAICALWVLSGRILRVIERIPGLEKLVMFVARNSIWTYLWHIMAIKVLAVSTFGHYLADYLVVYGFGVLLTWVQVSIVNKLLLPSVENVRLKKNLMMILTG